MILLSAGHNEQKKGASFNGRYEFDIATKWIKIIHDILGSSISIIVPAMTLEYKVDFVNSHNPEFALELHFNSATAKTDELDEDGDPIYKHIGSGCETLYHPDSIAGANAAQIIQNGLSDIFQPDRGIKEGFYQMNPKNKVDYFLRKTSCPAVIVEPEFIHLLENIDYNEEKACESIANSLIKIIKME